MSDSYAAAGVEPPLNEAMADAVVRMVMRRDGLTAEDVWRVIEAARRRVAEGPDERRPAELLQVPDLPSAAAP